MKTEPIGQPAQAPSSSLQELAPVTFALVQIKNR
jgi:hypothetical protein